MQLRKIGEKGKRYDVRDKLCIGRDCLRLHDVAIRGATSYGSRTSGYRSCCARREYGGCPSPLPAFDRHLASVQRFSGIRVVGGVGT